MSNINFASINENFPVAGQDNDTQTFRDNFDSIKTALSTAKTEITALEGNGDIDSGAARRDADNNFNGNLIQNATLLNNVETVNPIQNRGPTDTTSPLDFASGAYQSFMLGSAAHEFTLANFFEADGTKLAKMTVEMYSDVTTTVTFSLPGSGASAIKTNSTYPGTLVVDSATDPVIVEIWRHSTDNFYINYLGTFA